MIESGAFIHNNLSQGGNKISLYYGADLATPVLLWSGFKEHFRRESSVLGSNTAGVGEGTFYLGISPRSYNVLLSTGNSEPRFCS